MKKITTTVALLLILSFSLVDVAIVRATATGDIHGNTYINEDGTISPSDSPIQRDGNIYTLIGDLHGAHLIIERNNIIFDGNGHTLYQDIQLRKVTNVTVENTLIINHGGLGISFDYSSNITIFNNTISGCGSVDGSMGPLTAAICIISGDSIVIVGNTLIENEIALIVTIVNTLVYYNNFFDNHYGVREWGALGFSPVPAIAIFDNGKVGNYWSKYNGSDANGDGVGDTPYIIDSNNKDNYPLMKPISNVNYSSPISSPTILPTLTASPSITPSPSSTHQPTLEPSPTLYDIQAENFAPTIIIFGLVAIVVAVGVLVYFKKRR